MNRMPMAADREWFRLERLPRKTCPINPRIRDAAAKNSMNCTVLPKLISVGM